MTAMGSRFRLWMLLLATLVATSILAISWASAGSDESRLRKVEKTLDEVAGVAGQFNARLDAVRVKDEGLDARLVELKTVLDELKVSIGSLQSDVAALKGGSTSMQKKIDELGSKISAIDQRLWLLEARYNDHLRKYHGG